MSTTEKILEELNECRTNPSMYSQKISKILKYYRGKIFARPGYEAIETEEGSGNALACISYLKTVMPIEPLQWSQSLTLAAQMHADDIGPSGRMSHIGQDGSEPCDRIERFCQWSGHLGENIDYGNADSEDIVVSLLIDDGVLARGQRLNIMKREHKYAGVGFGYHSEYQYVCVILFAELVIESSITNTPSLSSVKKMKKSEYVKVKEITEEQSKLAASKKSKVKDINTLNLKSKEKICKPKFNLSDLSEDEIIEIKEFFDKLDFESSGTISVTEIKHLLEKQEPELSNSSMFQILANLDAKGVGTLDFDGFLSMMAEKVFNKKASSPTTIPEVSDQKKPLQVIHKRNFQLTQNIITELKDVFDLVDHENSGYADLESLQTALENKEQETYNTTILEIMHGFDKSQNSKLSFEDFIEIISNISEKTNSKSKNQTDSVKEENKTEFISGIFKDSDSSLVEFDVISKISKIKIPRRQMSSYQSYFKKTDVEESMRKQVKGFDPAEYESKGISQEQVLEIKRAFDLFDVDRKGIIDTEELRDAMEDQGFKRKNPTVFKLFCQLDLERKEKIDFIAFFNMLTERNETSSEDEIKKFFDLFDREGLGYIEIKNLKNVVKDLGESLDDEDIVDLIRKSDLDGDGKVTYQDFYNIMSKAV
ncbi:hypothetical protein SteCoe_19613 [Stentor coeruleus]|uniref:EF-hand domain-containing protein n=1 Tax=Stentor coeruleus TaxID=5963 RepID=A0A1R2BTX1_9CILI|nr:hypothetical protein SteCoe_19613 [Stentor coeruleus]